MTHGSLFSGIGGFDLAAEWMGWENKFHCEWNEFGQRVLHYYWPEAELFTDITKSDFKKYANTIDVLTGGFPCQPFSNAGQRKGTDDERYLWGEMLRAIQEIEPTFVIAENVFGITTIDGGLVFQQVCLDLEGQGYEVQAFIIPACGKNAPHRRERCFFIATNTKLKSERSDGRADIETKENLWRKNTSDVLGALCSDGNVTDTNGWEREQSAFNSRMGRIRQSNERDSWGVFPTEHPFCSGNDGLSNELDGITFPKWRQQTMKAYGNAVVPQIAHQLFQILETL